MLFVWISPIVLFLVLSAARGVPALIAAMFALVLSSVVVIGFGPIPVTGIHFASMFVGGAWIALPAVLVILAGLYFSEVLESADRRRFDKRVANGISARESGTICLFVGPFVETATGFGVGYVVAVTALVRAGIKPVGALALGAFSQCLVPWGALGVGTKISAAIAGVPLDDLSWRIAIVVAPLLWIIVPLYWRIAEAADVKIDRAQRLEDVASISVLSALLIVTNLTMPIELAGLVAIGLVLLFRFWLIERGRLFSVATMQRGIPYVILIVLLGISKFVPDVKTALASPAWSLGRGAPSFAPLASPAIPLILATVLGCLVHGHWSSLPGSVSRTVQKGARACLMTILLVAMAWIIVQSGIAAAFAEAIKGWIGDRASLLVPALGGLGGYLTGSNTGGGSLSMPVAKLVSDGTEKLLWVAAASIVAGSVFTAFSPVRFAMGQAISKADKNDTGRALRWLMPYGLASLTVAMLAVLLTDFWID